MVDEHALEQVWEALHSADGGANLTERLYFTNSSQSLKQYEQNGVEFGVSLPLGRSDVLFTCKIAFELEGVDVSHGTITDTQIQFFSDYRALGRIQCCCTAITRKCMEVQPNHTQKT